LQAEALGAADPALRALVEDVDGGLLAPGRGGRDVLCREGRLAHPGRAEEHDAAAVVDAASQHGVELGQAAFDGARGLLARVVARHQPREHLEAAGADGVVVIAVAEGDAAHLAHPQAPALAAVAGRELLQRQHAVGEALELEVAGGGARVVEQQHRAALAGEVVLEGQDLPPVAQRVAGQQAHLGERVEHHPHGAHPLHGVEHRAGGLGKLHLRGVEEGVLRVGLEALLGRLQLADGDAVERPAVGGGHVPQLLLGLGEGGIDPRLAIAGARE
jgi:hypothetical protein